MAPLAPSLDSLRRQLEGRWEQLERARERYTTLLRHLSSLEWKQQLRKDPELPRQMLEAEAGLDEVLDYVKQRARLEQWPPEHPGFEVVSGLRAWRQKLKALVHKRLGRPSRQFQHDTPWMKALEQLDVFVRAPVPQLPNPSEFVLLKGESWSGIMPGYFWLTPERLVWQPWNDEPVQVMLASLAAEDISVSDAGFGVQVQGSQQIRLITWWRTSPLARLIDICRRFPRLQAAQPHEQKAIVCPAYSHTADYPTERRWGLALFRPGYVAFLPTHRLTPREHALRLVSREVRQPGNPELFWQEAMLEHLRRLPPAEFDSAVRELVKARGGHLWLSAEVYRAPDTGRDLQFDHLGDILGIPGGSRGDTLQPFLAHHFPHATAPSEERPRKSFWVKRPLERAGLATGLLLLAMHVPWPGSFMLPPTRLLSVYLLLRAVFTWACMRYAKSRGNSPLRGLFLSLLCWPGMFFLIIPGRKPKSSRRPS